MDTEQEVGPGAEEPRNGNGKRKARPAWVWSRASA